jgi:dipeptidyl-peptidase-4
VAEFVAAEEMGRHRGYWWSPTGDAVLAARVDESPVQRWYIADPANPSTPATEVRYPVAGSAEADVTLHVLRLDGGRTDVTWDRAAFPYLTAASWSPGGAVVQVMSRDQRRAEVRAVDPSTGATSRLVAQSDPVWLDVVAGVPALLPDGRLVTTTELGGARRLVVDGEPVTDTAVQVA